MKLLFSYFLFLNLGSSLNWMVFGWIESLTVAKQPCVYLLIAPPIWVVFVGVLVYVCVCVWCVCSFVVRVGCVCVCGCNAALEILNCYCYSKCHLFSSFAFVNQWNLLFLPSFLNNRTQQVAMLLCACPQNVYFCKAIMFILIFWMYTVSS